MEITATKFYQQLVVGEPLTVLDVRNPDEVQRAHIEGSGVHFLAVPYFEILEKSGKDDLREAAVAYAKSSSLADLSPDHPLIVVCAKGRTSKEIAQGLRSLHLPAQSLAGGMQGWGNYLHPQLIERTAHDTLYQVVRPARGCLSYLLISDGQALVIDPCRHIDLYRQLCVREKAQLACVLDTHCHADHLSGALALSREHHIPYRMHPYDAIHPVDLLPARFPLTCLWEGDTVRLGDIQLEILHIPGHTLGNCAFLLNERYLFSGDSIFLRSIARPDLGGHAKSWTALHYRSLKRLASLSGSLKVLPGHFASFAEADSTGHFVAPLDLVVKGEELSLVASGEEAFASYVLSHLSVIPPEYVDIKRANLGLIKMTEEQSSELESGKNLCAVSDHATPSL